MKVNKLTPGKNLLWESSRMILPEHRAQMIAQRERQALKQRPILDEHRLQDISQLIAESLHNQTEITLVQFNEIQDREFTGRVLKVDQQLRRVKISDPTFEYFWLPFADIVEVRGQ